MKNNLLKMALVAGMIALTTVGASAAGIGIYVGPSHPGYRTYHHPHHFQHRVCNRDRFGYRHCFWR